jgi:hypothetical protein
VEDGVGPFDRMVGSVLIRPALDQGVVWPGDVSSKCLGTVVPQNRIEKLPAGSGLKVISG